MTASEQDRPPYRWALVTFVLVFVIYVLTLAPTTAFWDASEYIAAAKVLGIPHPPGNPLFVILAHVFGLLPLAESYAVRINLFAAVTSAGGRGVLVPGRPSAGSGASCRIAGPGTPRRWAARWSAPLPGRCGTSRSVNEKVYTVSLLSIALVMWLVVRWGDDEPGPHRDRWLVLIAYVLALTATNHLMGFLALPALGIYVLWTDWRVVVQPWAIVTFYALLLAVTGTWLDMFAGDGATGRCSSCVTRGRRRATRSGARPGIRWSISASLAVVVGISLNYLWLPLRAAQYPPINEGEPVGMLQPGAAGRAQPGAVRQAVAHRTPGQLQRPAGQLLAVLRLAVRPRLGPLRRRGHRGVHGAGAERTLDAVEVGPPGRPGRARRCSAC